MTDSATQPDPHYCTRTPRQDGTEEGCPAWPECLFSAGPAHAPAPVVLTSRALVRPEVTWDGVERWLDRIATLTEQETTTMTKTPGHGGRNDGDDNRMLRSLGEAVLIAALGVLVIAVLWAVLA